MTARTAARYIPKIFTNQVNNPKRYYYVNHRLRKAWSTTRMNPNAEQVTFEKHAEYVKMHRYQDTYFA